MLAVGHVRPSRGPSPRGGCSGSGGPPAPGSHLARCTSWVPGFEPPGQLQRRRPWPEAARTPLSFLCLNLELRKCGLASWRQELGRQPVLRNLSPAELTLGLSLVSNVNLPDSREFAQKTVAHSPTLPCHSLTRSCCCCTSFSGNNHLKLAASSVQCPLL